MNISGRDWLAIFACAVLVVAAIALPVVILSPPTPIKISRPAQLSPPAEISRPTESPRPPQIERPTNPATSIIASRPTIAAPPAVKPNGEATKPDETAKSNADSKPEEMVQNNTDSNPEDAVDSYGPSRGELFAKVQARKPFSATDLSSSVPTNFSFPRDADAHADKVFGIDIFHASDDLCGKPDSCKLDWKIIADQKVSFVYVKASQGNNPLPDKDFVRHWQSLAKQRYVMRGAYHFMSATSRPEDGAKSFVDKVMKAGGFSPRDLPPAMDLEWDYQGKGDDQWSGQSPDKIIDKALVWLKYVKEKTGRTPMIYTSRAWWEEVRIDFKKIERLKDYPIWIADYALNDQKLETPKLPDKWTWKLWQFTACGGLPGAGINSKWNPKVKCVGAVESLDVSFYPGTLPDFRKTFEIMMPAANDRIAHANDIVVPIEDPKKRDGLADENVIVARLELPQRDGGIPDKLEEIANIEQSQTQVQTEADNGPAAPRIEIEFPNGRKLRADANVDPVILARLIKVIEGGAPTGDTP